jgi:hypothetical protein
MTLGYRTIFRNTAEPGAGAGEDRLGAIEQRLAQLSGVLTTVASATAQRQKEDETSAEVNRAAKLVTDAETKVNTAKNELTAAYESGDAARISEATAKLTRFTTEATAASMNLTNVRARANRPAAQPAAQQQQRPTGQPAKTVDDTNLRDFRTANDWYDTDPDMTAAARKAHREIAAEGLLDVGSKAYFNAIEARVRSQFPDRVRAAPTGGYTAPKGSPMTNNRADEGSDRIPSSIADGYRRMGIDVDNADTARSLVEARKTAVRKGFLTEKPVLDRVVSR